MKKIILKKGFTLIELLIVITIIGILAAAFLPNILSAPARARDAARQGDLTKVVAALEVFNADLGHYPATLAAGSCIDNLPAGGDADAFAGYFPSGIPSDPDTTASIAGCTTGGYFYCLGDGSNGNYLLMAQTETDTENANAAVMVGTGCAGTAALPDAFATVAGAYAIIN